ncbi:hypothetical protein [Streptomyces sp. NPDC058335]|uniref:hypothetical protein n=1 Tax=Streptomyces sp. NPDC058335 TaxID=3346451 RepID=UPI0036464299
MAGPAGVPDTDAAEARAPAPTEADATPAETDATPAEADAASAATEAHGQAAVEAAFVAGPAAPGTT